jgi:hypothetical protein
VSSQIEHTLLIDRAAAASRPDQQAIREWAADQRVFISSVISGYSEYRQAAVAAVEALGAEPVCWERFGGRDSDPNEAYLAEVRSSSIYVGLLGSRYGRLLPDRYSATHQEFREAEREGLRTTVWAQEGVDREGPQESFFEEVRAFGVTGSYDSPAELRERLETRLKEIAAEDLSPWVKLGGLIFRATEIEERGAGVVVRATIRDQAVIAAVRALADGPGRQSVLLSYADRTLLANVQAVAGITRAARAVAFEIEVKSSPIGQPTRMTFNGMPWSQLTQLAVRVSFFGEPNQLGLMSHIASLPNPFAAIAEAGVAEEAIRPISRLLVSEILIAERGVERLTTFQLGREIIGRRRLKLGCRSRRPTPMRRRLRRSSCEAT